MDKASKHRKHLGRFFGGAALLAGAALPAAAQEVELDFYGHVMMDAIYDFDRVNSDWNDTLRPSQIPVNCPGDAGCGSDGNSVKAQAAIEYISTKLGGNPYEVKPVEVR